MKRYAEDLKTLGAMLAPGVLRVEAESEVFARARIPARIRADLGIADTVGVTPALFFRVAEANYALFKDYLRESARTGGVPVDEADGSQDFRALDSYRKLEAVGWKGAIPQVQRDYYLGRARNEYGRDAPDAVIEDRVARYLGAAFARVRLQLVAGSHEDRHGVIPPLKFSYIQHPPGTPATLQRDRLEYIALDNKGDSNRRVAPWCGVGVFELSEGGSFRATIEGASQFRTFEARQEATLILVGGDPKSPLTLRLPADVVKHQWTNAKAGS
jgi:hypothetical protein